MKRPIIVAFLSALILATTQAIALAEPFTYVNPRFGTVCTFPKEIFTDAQPEPANGDGQQWLASDGANLICSGIINIDDETPKSFAAQEAANTDAGARITYSRTGKDWVVLSGFKGGNIFYARRLFGEDGVIRTVWIEYPAALKSKYDPLVGPIAGSLQGP